MLKGASTHLRKDSDEHGAHLHRKIGSSTHRYTALTEQSSCTGDAGITFSLSISISGGSVDPGGTTATETGPLATSAMSGLTDAR